MENQHKRRSSSPERRSHNTDSDAAASPPSALNTPDQELIIPFAFSSETVSPLSADQSARGRIRRRLSEEGDSVDARSSAPIPEQAHQHAHQQQLQNTQRPERSQPPSAAPSRTAAVTTSEAACRASSAVEPSKRSHPHRKKLNLMIPSTSASSSLPPPSGSRTSEGAAGSAAVATSSTNVLGLQRLTPPSSTSTSAHARSTSKSTMAMRRRASLPKLNLAVATRLPSPKQVSLGINTATCATSRLLDSFSATTNPLAQEEYPYADGPIEVSPGLYLGAEHNTKDGDLLRKLNIGAVLNVAKEVKCPYYHVPSSATTEAAFERATPSSSSSAGTSPASAASHANVASSSSTSSHLLAEPRGIRIAASTPDLRAQYSDALTSLAHARAVEYAQNDRFPALNYLHVPLSHDVSNLAPALPSLLSFVSLHLDRGVSVLVHCQCGVSRSASVVVAWVMQAQQMAMHAAYDQVKTKSPYISPNISLLYQLMDFEKAQKSPSNATSGSSSLGDDDDYVKTPPEEQFDGLQDKAIVDGLLSPALADRLAFTPPNQITDLPSEVSLSRHQIEAGASANGFPIITHQQPSPSSKSISPESRQCPSPPRISSRSDQRPFRSQSGPQRSHSLPSPSLASPFKSHFNFDFGGLSTVPEGSNPFSSSRPSEHTAYA